MRGLVASLLGLSAAAGCGALSCGGPTEEESACSLLPKSAVVDALRSAGSEARSIRQSASESLHQSVCRFVGRGIDVRLSIDTAPEVRRRYFTRVTEQLTYNVHRSERRPHAIEDLGDEHAYGPAGAYWVPAYRQLFALDGERLLLLSFGVREVGAREARIAAEGLARIALRQPRGRSPDHEARPVQLDLSIFGPVDGELVHGRTAIVHGTVTGRNARVRVAGRPAGVRNGVFARGVSLKKGVNSVTVVAFGDRGQRKKETIRVRRGRSPRQIGLALRRRHPGVVPDLLGERLDVAETILRYAGLASKRVKVPSGRVVPREWAVCLTRPPPGTRVESPKKVVLLIDRAEIYRVSGTACARE